jgi:hypothetical protein
MGVVAETKVRQLAMSIGDVAVYTEIAGNGDVTLYLDGAVVE